MTQEKAVARRPQPELAVFDPFRAMDMLDDAAIIAELEGQVVDKWVYHFPQEGKEIWGLSKVGVDQACREMAGQGEVIREEDVVYQLDPTDNRFILFKAFASRVAVSKDGGEVRLDRTTGTKRQCVFQVTTKEGVTTRPNAFWFEQGSIKALRNARLRLISEEVRSKIMTMAKTKGKVSEVKGPKQPSSSGQAPTSTLVKVATEGIEAESGGNPPESQEPTTETDRLVNKAEISNLYKLLADNGMEVKALGKWLREQDLPVPKSIANLSKPVYDKIVQAFEIAL